MKEYNRYKFKSNAKLISGDKLSFFKLLNKNVNQNSIVLDLGCGSGELTIQMASHCLKIIGIDCCEEYIRTANRDKKNKKIKNVFFKLGDGRRMLFKDKMFDVVYSSRGPLSANSNFFKEAVRVLKDGGILIEETIGETDKIELKKIFERGQNFPYLIKKQESVRNLLGKFKMREIFLRDFIYYQKFPSLNSVIRTLERAPIIPNFDSVKDRDKLLKVGKLYRDGGITLRAHRLWWIAKK